MSMRKCLAGVLAAVAFAHFAATAHAGFVDDFNDNITNPNFWGIGTSNASGVTVAEKNQRVEISFAADAHSLYDPMTGLGTTVFGAGCWGLWQVSGDFDLRVDYHLLDWPSGNGVRVGLGAAKPGQMASFAERVSFAAGFDFPGFPREVYLADWRGGVAGIRQTNDQSGSLRLARVADVFTAYYRGATDWVPISSRTSGPTGDLIFGMNAWSHDGYFADQEVKVAFDNFRATEVVPEPSALVLCTGLGTAAVVMAWRRRKRAATRPVKSAPPKRL